MVGAGMIDHGGHASIHVVQTVPQLHIMVS